MAYNNSSYNIDSLIHDVQKPPGGKIWGLALQDHLKITEGQS